MLVKNDFERTMLPSSWHYLLNKQEGHSIEFAVRAKPVLKRSTKDYVINSNGVLVRAPTYLFETVNFYVTKNPCSKEGLE